jgi:glycerate kinase
MKKEVTFIGYLQLRPNTPLKVFSFAIGEIITDLVDKGARKIVVDISNSKIEITADVGGIDPKSFGYNPKKKLTDSSGNVISESVTGNEEMRVI